MPFEPNRSSSPLKISIQILPHGEGIPLPSYQTEGSSGMDLYAAMDDDVVLFPMERHAIPTGIALSIPEGFEGQVRPRSGLALRHGLSIPNSPGTIDADYRGEILVLLINLGPQSVSITRGMRIAQLVIAPVIQASFTTVIKIDQTPRGKGGFGSTGS